MVEFFKERIKEGMNINDIPIKWRNAVIADPEIKDYYSLTNEDIKNIFEENKVAKITESKVLLANYLETHPLISNCHGGIDALYSVTSEKQSLMSGNYLTYTIAKQSGTNVKLTWNAMGKECEEWTEEEFVTLVLQK